MKKRNIFIVAFVVVLSAISLPKNNQNGFKDTDLNWWAEAMASDGESGGSSHSLSCDNGIGVCSGECGVHQVKITKSGKSDTATFTCG